MGRRLLNAILALLWRPVACRAALHCDVNVAFLFADAVRSADCRLAVGERLRTRKGALDGERFNVDEHNEIDVLKRRPRVARELFR